MQEDNFKNYYAKILKTLKEDMQMNKMNSVQSLIVILAVSTATTKEELKSTIEKLVQKYPNLEEVNFLDKAEARIKSEEVIEKIAIQLIKGGKTEEASEFSKFANSHSFEETKSEFPQYF